MMAQKYNQWTNTKPSTPRGRKASAQPRRRWRREMAPNQWLAERRQKLTTGFEKWMNRQPDYVEVAAVTLGGAVQGGAIGGMMGMITKMDPDTPQKVANASNPTQAAVRGCVRRRAPARTVDPSVAPSERQGNVCNGKGVRTVSFRRGSLTRAATTGFGGRTLGTSEEFRRHDWRECGIVACHQESSRWRGRRPGKVRPRFGTTDAMRTLGRMHTSSELKADTSYST